MATKHSLPTYYHETPAIVSLMNTFGDRFEDLGAAEKFTLIGVLARWQSFDTESQAAGKGEMPFSQALQNTAIGLFYAETTSDAQVFLDTLVSHNADERDAIPLITALINQISEGVYQR